MSDLTIFQFESHEVRFIGTAENPWWVAVDVCAAVDVKNPSQAIERLDDDERAMFNIGRQGEAWCINESGLYSLILTSRKAQAKRFKKWVTSVVLPSIRKTGKYELPQALQPPSSLPTPTAQEISELFDLTLGGAGLDPRLIAGVKLNVIASYNPALLEAAEIAKSALSIPVDEGLVRPTVLGEKLEAKTGQKWSAIKVNKLLIERGFQILNPDGKNPAYLPTEKGSEYSQMVLDTARGRDKTVQSLQWHLSVLEALGEENNGL
ncbi:MAG: phage antirepressor [Nostoc sp. NMS2]|nr:BRO family protein [Nostoc sp. NMS2]MBN3993853.1 phage antirepressor [Nostoc sp. NMS2]